jgi:peptidyl-prolyl cis-trans isomerase SurA
MRLLSKIMASAVVIAFMTLGLHATAPGKMFSWKADNDTTQGKRPVKVVRIPESSIVDEVIWVVGDEPILKSDVEAMRLQAEEEGIRWQGDPD